MYFYMKKYESKSKWRDDGSVADPPKGYYPRDLEKLEKVQYEHDFLSKTHEYQVGYMRKMNAIHGWIVKNCAGGEDDCSEVYISKEKLEELLNICEQVKEDHRKAPKLLPTTDGFFFGGTDYGDYYYVYVDYAIQLFTNILEVIEKEEKEEKETPSWYRWEVYYQASW